MALTEEQRRTLLARAKSLRERIACKASVPASAADGPTVSTRRERWAFAASKGNTAAFEALLARRNLKPEDLGAILGPSRWMEGVGTPDWTESIDAVLDAASGMAATEQGSDLCSVPFADFFAPFCAVARQRLVLALSTDAHPLSEAVLYTVIDNLAHSLYFVFQSALAVQRTVDGIQHGTAASDRLFATALRQPKRLTRFLLEYSVAARAATTLMQRWLRNTVEWVRRLAVDAEAIAHSFAGGAPLGQLKRIDCGLSDPHNGGQSVLRLHFASGLRLVYKPRPVALDLAYNNLLDWLEQRGAPHRLRRPVYLPREGYAWIEQIDHIPCESQEELLEFCSAAGALLCVGYLLDATDLHDGNLIAAQASPIPIDLETLLQPRLAAPTIHGQQDALRKAAVLADHSILRTGLLPSLKAGPDGTLADVGCLGGLFDARSAGWYQHDATASPLSGAMRNAVASGTWNAAHLVDRLAQGFAQTYGFMLGHREALLASTGPLQGFSHQRVRFLLRDTSVYVKLLASSFSALALREGIDRSIVMESLYRMVLTRPDSEALASAIETEIDTLEALDIPLVQAATHSVQLQSPPGVATPILFEQPSFEAMLDRLRGFSETDLAQQLELLKGAFAARAASAQRIANPSAAPPPPVNVPLVPNGPVTARAIAEALRHRAMIGDDGSATWMAPVPIAGTAHFRFDMVPLNLEFGAMGIALFLAAYDHVVGDTAYGALAKQAVQTVVQRLRLGSGASPGHSTLTSISGMGSMLYALQRVGGLLNAPHITTAAQRLAERLPDFQPALLQGPTGWADCSELCLGLVAMHSHDKARAWGQWLLEHWSMLDHTGQSAVVRAAPHLALCWHRLHMIEPSGHFIEARRGATACMYQAYGQDSRQATHLQFALLACTDRASEPIGSSWLSDQLAVLSRTQPGGSNNLQHGTCSVVERLLTASQVLNRPQLRDTAQNMLEAMAREAASAGGYQTIAGMPRDAFFPSFAQGLCGIGYTLLRCESDTALPCVPLWD